MKMVIIKATSWPYTQITSILASRKPPGGTILRPLFEVIEGVFSMTLWTLANTTMNSYFTALRVKERKEKQHAWGMWFLIDQNYMQIHSKCYGELYNTYVIMETISCWGSPSTFVSNKYTISKYIYFGKGPPSDWAEFEYPFNLYRPMTWSICERKKFQYTTDNNIYSK